MIWFIDDDDDDDVDDDDDDNDDDDEDKFITRYLEYRTQNHDFYRPMGYIGLWDI